MPFRWSTMMTRRACKVLNMAYEAVSIYIVPSVVSVNGRDVQNRANNILDDAKPFAADETSAAGALPLQEEPPYFAITFCSSRAFLKT